MTTYYELFKSDKFIICWVYLVEDKALENYIETKSDPNQKAAYRKNLPAIIWGLYTGEFELKWTQ